MNKTIQEIINEIPKDILARFVPVSFDVGEYIIDINSKVNRGYIFIEGAIDVMHINSKDVLYTYCQDYSANFIGLMEIYSGSDTYCCTCRARKKCVGYRLSKEILLKMLDECDEFKKYLIKYWANQFYSQALNRTQYPNNITKVKIISYLSDLIEKEKNKKEILLKLRRKDIAEYIGCSMRTVYRILNQLEESGLIKRKGHSILINSQQRKKF